MPEKEKVMTVVLMRSDPYSAPDYTGAFLKLHASGYSGEYLRFPERDHKL